MIVGDARPMLHDQGLPMHLWVEACNTVVYVKKRCPHRVLGMTTPEEYFTGNKLDISHLKILQQISTRIPKGNLAQSDQCKGCTMGKFVKTTFHEKENCASVILERVQQMCVGHSRLRQQQNTGIMLIC